MFIPLYQLSLYDPAEENELTNRWTPVSGQNPEEVVKAREFVLGKIRKGAGEDFLQLEYEKDNGKLSNIIEDMFDLRGISIIREDIKFPNVDNFEAIDFSYAYFSKNKFVNAYFRCSFNFTKFYDCTFEDCIFHNNIWLGSHFENCNFVNCEFIEHTKFKNCSFVSTRFNNYFIQENLFENCKFAATVKIDKPNINYDKRKNYSGDNFTEKNLSDFYSSLEEAFKAGNVKELKRKYYYKTRQARTKYNSSKYEHLYKYLIEIMTGYGVKPLRSFIIGLITIIFFSKIYMSSINNIEDAFFASLRAFFTLGDIPYVFNEFLKVTYLVEGILGWFIMGIYLTTLVNVWFTDK